MTKTRTRLTIAVLLAMLSLASHAGAQPSYEEQWGVNIGITPAWDTGTGVKYLFKADRIDLHGSEVRIGFVRGRQLEGDWGISYVSKDINEDSSIDVDVLSCPRGQCGTFYRTLTQNSLTGVEFHHFEPFKTWKNRIQLGMVGAIGIGWMRGNVYRRTVTDQNDVESFEAPAGELFPPSKDVVPLLKIEVAGVALVARGVKVRASGGFSMPGYHTFSVSFVYLIPKF
jgi:hypothetical protein